MYIGSIYEVVNRSEYIKYIPIKCLCSEHTVDKHVLVDWNIHSPIIREDFVYITSFVEMDLEFIYTYFPQYMFNHIIIDNIIRDRIYFEDNIEWLKKIISELIISDKPLYDKNNFILCVFNTLTFDLQIQMINYVGIEDLKTIDFFKNWLGSRFFNNFELLRIFSELIKVGFEEKQSLYNHWQRGDQGLDYTHYYRYIEQFVEAIDIVRNRLWSFVKVCRKFTTKDYEVFFEKYIERDNTDIDQYIPEFVERYQQLTSKKIEYSSDERYLLKKIKLKQHNFHLDEILDYFNILSDDMLTYHMKELSTINLPNLQQRLMMVIL